MCIAGLDVESAAAKRGFALVVELHPGSVLIEAGALPLEVVVGGTGGADVGREKVHGAAKRPKDRP